MCERNYLIKAVADQWGFHFKVAIFFQCSYPVCSRKHSPYHIWPRCADTLECWPKVLRSKWKELVSQHAPSSTFKGILYSFVAFPRPHVIRTKYVNRLSEILYQPVSRRLNLLI